MRTLPRGKLRPTLEEVKAPLAQDRPLVQAVRQELLEAEMTAALAAAYSGERLVAGRYGPAERPPARRRVRRRTSCKAATQLGREGRRATSGGGELLGRLNRDQALRADPHAVELRPDLRQVDGRHHDHHVGSVLRQEGRRHDLL